MTQTQSQNFQNVPNTTYATPYLDPFSEDAEGRRRKAGCLPPELKDKECLNWCVVIHNFSISLTKLHVHGELDKNKDIISWVLAVEENETQQGFHHHLCIQLYRKVHILFKKKIYIN